MKTVALYARVSSEKQAQQDTVASQVAVLQERAKADGQVVLPSDIYIDEGYSGATLARPGLERLRDRVAEGGPLPFTHLITICNKCVFFFRLGRGPAM